MSGGDAFDIRLHFALVGSNFLHLSSVLLRCRFFGWSHCEESYANMSVSALLTKYVLVALAAQVALSVINSLFILTGGGDVALALLGFFGIFQRLPTLLIFFATMELLSISMDIVRLVLWSPYILNNVLQVPGTLGTFFLVLTVFQTIVKLVCVIFSFMIRKEIIDWSRDPSVSSTLNRQNPASFMPDFLMANSAMIENASLASTPSARNMDRDFSPKPMQYSGSPVPRTVESTPLLMDPVVPPPAGNSNINSSQNPDSSQDFVGNLSFGGKSGPDN